MKCVVVFLFLGWVVFQILAINYGNEGELGWAIAYMIISISDIILLVGIIILEKIEHIINNKAMTDKLTPGHQEDAKKIIEFVGSVKPIEAMTDKDRELAEDVIRDFIQDEYLPRHRMILDVDEIIELMQAYHSAKMQEVTDEDIEVKANDIANPESILAFERGEWLGFKEGAKAMRDGKINHKEG